MNSWLFCFPKSNTWTMFWWQFLHRLRFQVEPLDGFFVGGGVENLEGDFALELFVEGFVDKSHAAFAEGADKVVVLVEGPGKIL